MMRYVLLLTSLFMISSCATFVEDGAAPAPPDMAPAKVFIPTDEAATQESAPNLREELTAPDSGVAVDVRSYQRQDGATITEYAVNGRVYKIKVQPAGDFPAYYLYDPNGDGKFEPQRHGMGPQLSPPTWVLQEF